MDGKMQALSQLVLRIATTPLEAWSEQRDIAERISRMPPKRLLMLKTMERHPSAMRRTLSGALSSLSNAIPLLWLIGVPQTSKHCYQLSTEPRVMSPKTVNTCSSSSHKHPVQRTWLRNGIANPINLRMTFWFSSLPIQLPRTTPALRLGVPIARRYYWARMMRSREWVLRLAWWHFGSNLLRIPRLDRCFLYSLIAGSIFILWSSYLQTWYQLLSILYSKRFR